MAIEARFTDQVWQLTAGIRAAIDALPFLQELRAGSLTNERFRYYLTQDSAYLLDYGRALAAAAAQSSDSDDLVFWSEAARTAVMVERSLHADHGADLDGAMMSPTCLAYTSYLTALTGRGDYPSLVAGLLPCFWVYQDVGARLAASVPDLESHPYRDWIAAYDDPVFAQATLQAKELVDRVAAASSPATTTRMSQAFVTATRYEWMFWDAGYRMETWPV